MSLRKINLSLSLVMVLVLSFLSISSSTAMGTAGYVRRVRTIEPGDTGVMNPIGLVFSPKSSSFFAIGQQGQSSSTDTEFIRLNGYAEHAASGRIPVAIQAPLNMAFDNKTQHLLILQPTNSQMLEVEEGLNGEFNSNGILRFNTKRFGIQDPQGLTVDLVSGSVFILDAVGPRIIRLERGPDGSFESGTATGVNLPDEFIAPRGIALDPMTSNLHVLSTGNRKLYELTQAGQVVAFRDLSEFSIGDPQGMTFAPSGDQTDDPAQMSLYITDSGQVVDAASSTQLQMDSTTSFKTSADATSFGQIVELALAEPILPAASNFASSTVRITDMSAINPPSPDPSGIAYRPNSNTVIIVDGEVEETVSGITHFEGANVWELTMSGSKIRTANISKVAPTVVPMSNEPTGIAWNPYNGHYYVSQDDGKEVFDLNPGQDGLVGTADDRWTSFDTAVYNSGDPEGIAYDT